MDIDTPDFLGGEPAPETEAPAAEAPVAEAPAAEGPARGPDGKFAAAEPVSDAGPAAPVADAPHAPISALLDERDKRQAAERERDAATREARELREWRAQQEAAARRQPVPDRDADPEGFERHRQAQIDSALYGQRLEMSRTVAELKHGEDVTKTAFEWGVQRCDEDPFFNEKVRASKDPVGLVVAEWKRDHALSQVGDPAELDAFLAWKAANPGVQAAPASPPAPPAAPTAPRASLAGAPSAGANADALPRDGEQTFDAMFN